VTVTTKTTTDDDIDNQESRPAPKKRKTRKNLLTDMQVRKAKDGWLNDGGGLHLRVKGASRKWVFRYTWNGNPVEIGCGGADRVSLKAARELRERYLDALALGADPRAEKAKAAASARTFGETAAELIEARKKNWRTSVNDGRQSSLSEWTRSLMVACKRIANRSVADIVADDIKPIVKPVWDKGSKASARRLLNRIEMVFDFAEASEWRTADNPATWKKFQHILQAQGESGPKDHHPALGWREMPRFMARLRADTRSPMAALALEMMILTATRSGEARGMRWDEVDLEAATWTIPASRMKRKLPHEVPLSTDAIRLLKRLEPARIGPLTFPGRGWMKPVDHVGLWFLVQRLTGREAGQPIVASPHGMRSAARSWMAAQEVPFDVAEACLAHATGNATVAAYHRESHLEKRRVVLQDWADFLRGAEIIPLKALTHATA
jgi:integrase